MKNEHIVKEALNYETGSLPADIREHFSACEEDRLAYESMLAVRDLMALKSYEKPEPTMLDRCRRDVRRTILAQQHAEDEVPSLLPVNLIPILRYGLAAAFVGMLAFHVVSVFQDPSTPDLFTQPAKTENAPAYAMTNIASVEPLVRVPSNRRPRSVQYGTTPSELVDY